MRRGGLAKSPPLCHKHEAEDAMISAGEQAPDFSGTLADGRQLRLRDFRGRRHVVLYFFPKDFTPG
jgi:thioredoxin-dependent peroxiredoxin